MKYILLLFLLIVFYSCTEKNKNNYQKPEKVIIQGKINNINQNERSITIFVYKLGLQRDILYLNADSLGNFKTEFETYIPTVVFLQTNVNIPIIVNPKDSIYIEYDNQFQSSDDILNSVKFGGDANKDTEDALEFYKRCRSYPLLNRNKSNRNAVKKLGVNDYLNFIDSLKQESDELYDSFIKEINPSAEVKIWSRLYLDQRYYDKISFYPEDHRDFNNLSREEWDVDISFYDKFKDLLPMNESMFISANALSSFINRYHHDYVSGNIWEEKANQKYVPRKGVIIAPTEIMDSIVINGIIKYTKDTLLRQMVLTELFSENFKKSDIRFFEKYQDIVDLYIKLPFLKEPLYEQYYDLKERIEKPKIASDAFLKKIAVSSAKQIMDSIMQSNKGKVIYLDCWATWCGPCKVEMPNSKELMKKMKGKDVAFVYLCLDSEEKLWKASLAELQLTGQHYFLTKEQSTDIRKVFEVNSIPHYFLINKQGTIIEKGSHLRPNHVEEKIEKLLKEYKLRKCHMQYGFQWFFVLRLVVATPPISPPAGG